MTFMESFTARFHCTSVEAKTPTYTREEIVTRYRAKLDSGLRSLDAWWVLSREIGSKNMLAHDDLLAAAQAVK